MGVRQKFLGGVSYPLPDGMTFDFPQDIYPNPKTNGRNINRVSALLTDREAYNFGWTITGVSNAGGIFAKNFAIDQSFTYWVSNLSIVPVDPATGNISQLNGLLVVTDDETGYSFLRGNVSLYGANVGARSTRATWPMAYRIRAGSSFTASLLVPTMTAYTTSNYQFNFEGWRDYSYG